MPRRAENSELQVEVTSYNLSSDVHQNTPYSCAFGKQQFPRPRSLQKATRFLRMIEHDPSY